MRLRFLATARASTPRRSRICLRAASIPSRPVNRTSRRRRMRRSSSGSAATDPATLSSCNPEGRGPSQVSAYSRHTSIRVCLAAAILLCGAFHCADARRKHGPSVQSEPGQFDYYLLTLSWSPTYCLIHPGDRAECAHKGYGFVLHGLWPQFDAGGYPENCSLDSLSPAAEAAGREVYPSANLLRHEWQRHGTCSGLDAVDYVHTADRALASVRIPSNLTAPSAPVTLTGAEVAAEFRAANPGMPQNALTVACSRGELSEVRLCLTRDLQPRSCGRGVRNSCPATPIEIPAAR